MGTSSTRTYGQACPLACALDVLGERWSLLIVRELLLGPARFSDLQRHLASAGPNRLSQRLHTLQDADVVRKNSSGSYELTTHGEALREPVVALAIWGLRAWRDDPNMHEARSDMLALCLSGALPGEQLAGMDLDCAVDADQQFTMRVRSGHMTVHRGTAVPPAQATTTLQCSDATFLELCMGTTDLQSSVSDGLAHIDGPTAALQELLHRSTDLSTSLLV